MFVEQTNDRINLVVQFFQELDKWVRNPLHAIRKREVLSRPATVKRFTVNLIIDFERLLSSCLSKLLVFFENIFMSSVLATIIKFCNS